MFMKKKSTTASHCRALVNIRHSTFVIKYAKNCTGIFGANFLSTIKQIFQLCCALKTLSKVMLFDLIYYFLRNDFRDSWIETSHIVLKLSQAEKRDNLLRIALIGQKCDSSDNRKRLGISRHSEACVGIEF